ncbi:Guanine nucleotide binding protein (G-protein), partial [Aphelenchoides avenae]
MLQLLNGARKLELDLPPEYEDYACIVSAVAHVTLVSFSERIFTAIKALWQTKVIQEVYERRSEIQLLDCAKYFLDDLDRLYSVDYCPTVDDVLNARVVTHGVHELRYPYGDHEFRIVDVGGQRSERRKWISVFDNVNAVFFVAAMSEYDQVMMEDDET